MGTGIYGGFGETYGMREDFKNYIESILPKSSPIKIPSSATIKVEHKNEYDQIKYTWKSGDYYYTSRWHTQTPNAPKEQGNSWVVERKKPGVGYGKMLIRSRKKFWWEKTSGYQNKIGMMQYWRVKRAH